MDNEITQKTVQPPEGQLSEILLVMDHEEKKIQAVKGIGKDGKLSTVEASKRNQGQFMRVDLHGDLFTNFFSNFFRQLKDPTRFSFFKVPLNTAVETAKKMQRQLDRPEPKNEKILTENQLPAPSSNTKQDHQQNSNIMETKQITSTTPAMPEAGEYRFKPEQIDWETMSNLGLSREKLEKMNLLEPLLKGYKTNELVPVNLNLGTAITRLDARLSLQESGEGKVVMAIHGIRREPNLNYPFFGHEFSQEDKDNLRNTGNMGRIVELTNQKTGEKIPSVISVDRLTNELVALRAEWIKVPDEIKGVTLDDHQKQTLLEGKPLHIEGMLSSKGELFAANVQFNADKRYVEFLFGRNNSPRQSEEQRSLQEPPKTFRGKDLDEQQYEKYKAGETIYVDGLVDKKGKPYQGYITFFKETGKTLFSFTNPEKLKEQALPAEVNKTQVAVNSDGKTNESTKKIDEPLKTGQQRPESKKQQEKQEKPKAPTNSKGVKV